MAGLYGAQEHTSTVIVADREGSVLLVVTGQPEGDPYRIVGEALGRLG